MKFQVKVEYGREKFVKFYVEADVVDGKVLRYSFSSLVEDIRRTCGSLRHHTSSTLRIRYKDEDNQWSVPAILLFTKNADYENEKCLKIKVFICILHSKQKKDTLLFNFDSPL